jgi:hypothetical protein
VSGVYRRCRTVTLPPPNFPPPFPRAVDIDTEPGIGLLQVKADLLAEKQRSERYRRERNVARQERDELQAAQAGSIPPPRSAMQKVAGGTVGVTKWVGVATLLLTAAAQIASTFKPGAVGPIESLLEFIKGFQ